MVKRVKDIFNIRGIYFLIFLLIGGVIGAKIIVGYLNKTEKGNDGNRFDINNESELSEYLTESFKKEGIKIDKSIDLYPSLINKITNLKLDEKSTSNRKKIYIDIVLSNGFYYQNCSLEGLMSCKKEVATVEDIKINDKSKIYREKDDNLNAIKKVVNDEIESGGIFKLENSGEYKESYIKSDESFIRNLEIKDFLIRDDCSVRVEVNGKIFLKKYENDYEFNGIVSISDELSDGSRKNAKSIVIYNVP
ncbi:MAG: hypothetical protein E7213_03265 [Clostridium sp.]|nr:hypothetical protein [Clostridium sp.]